MPVPIIIADFDHRRHTPEDCLYLAARIAQNVDPKHIFIVKILSPEDLVLLDQVADSQLGSGGTLILHFNDLFPPLALQRGYLDTARRYSIRRDITLVTAGAHVTLAPHLFVESELFDHVIAGWPWLAAPGEYAEPCDITQFHMTGKGYIPEELRFDSVFDCILNVAQCSSSNRFGKNFSYGQSRMCDNLCGFCFACGYAKNHGGYFKKDVKRIREELAFLRNYHGTSNVMLTNAKTSPEEIHLLLEQGLQLAELIDLCISDATPEFIDLLKKAGLQAAFVGIESLDSSVRKKIGKPYTEEHFSEILEYGHSQGIMFEGNAMFGIEACLGTPMTRRNLFERVRKLIGFYRRHPNLRLTIEPYMPYVGTPLGNSLWKKAGLYDSFTLVGYLDLVSTIIKGQPLQGSLPLPPCYDTVDTYDAVRKFSTDFNAIIRHKSTMYWFPPKSPSKRDFCEHLLEYCYQMLENGKFGFAGFVDTTHGCIEHWLLPEQQGSRQ